MTEPAIPDSFRTTGYNPNHGGCENGPLTLEALWRVGVADSPAERFLRRRVKLGPDECWEWPGGRSNKGYGYAKVQRRQVATHRIAFVLATGRTITADTVIMHSCDNPPCVNPAHLSAGTTLDNARDREAKGRSRPPLGEQHPNCQLTDAQVRDIRDAYAAGMTARQLADRYGIHINYARLLGCGKRRLAA